MRKEMTTKSRKRRGSLGNSSSRIIIEAMTQQEKLTNQRNEWRKHPRSDIKSWARPRLSWTAQYQKDRRAEGKNTSRKKTAARKSSLEEQGMNMIRLLFASQSAQKNHLRLLSISPRFLTMRSPTWTSLLIPSEQAWRVFKVACVLTSDLTRCGFRR